MSRFFLAIRLATWGLFAACVWVLVYDETGTGLFFGLLYGVLVGFLVLGIRLRARRRMRTLP